MRELSSLEQTLRRIDGRGYKAYRDIHIEETRDDDHDGIPDVYQNKK